MGANVPGGGENSKASAEALVVDGTGVNGEKSHQQDEIASSKHHAPDLNTEGGVGVGGMQMICSAKISSRFSPQHLIKSLFWWLECSLNVDVSIVQRSFD